ncbi:MAG TPA: hypothetical protein VLV89_12765 [Candidatus Acidoferrum sp.]|nr:hypothetical protein [Candidatus Acidoferrum sp.]
MANPDDASPDVSPPLRMDPAKDANGIPHSTELNSSDADTLVAHLGKSALTEAQLLHLLERKDLPGTALEEIGRHRDWLRSYRVRRALAFYVRVPRTLAIRILRELHLVDLVKLSLAPVAVADIRRLAEDQILSRLGQVTLGEKIALAKRSSGRVIAALIAEGVPRIFEPALRNPRLTESQILKLLANERLPERAVIGIASHPKWEALPNVRLALLRHPHTPLDLAAQILSKVTTPDVKALGGLKTTSPKLKQAIKREMAVRKSAEGKKP